MNFYCGSIAIVDDDETGLFKGVSGLELVLLKSCQFALQPLALLVGVFVEIVCRVHEFVFEALGDILDVGLPHIYFAESVDVVVLADGSQVCLLRSMLRR